MSPSTKDEVSFDDGSSRRERGAYLNCAHTQQKIDSESGGEASAQRRGRTGNDDRRSLVGAGVGGEADDDQETQVPEAPPPPQRRSRPTAQTHAGTLLPENQPLPIGASSNNGTGHAPASPTWPVPSHPSYLRIETNEEESAWRKASLFCAMWQQSITRLGRTSVCTATAGDRKAAFNFYLQEPQAGPYFTLATAIDAWSLADDPKPGDGGWDGIHHMRSSTELQAFLRSFASGKVESQIGQQGVEINAWADLRQCFTESELIYFHWLPSKVPLLALPADEIWEHDADAPEYYRKRHLLLPPEVLEAEKLHPLEKPTSKPISSKNKK